MNVAVVTGGNKGIGLAITKELVRNNYKVIVGARSLYEDQETVEDIDFVRSDLTKYAGHQELIDTEFEYIANKLDIPVSELHHYLNLPKKYYWDYKNSNMFFSVVGKIYSMIAKTQRGGAF